MDELHGLDVYSADGELVGRVVGYVEQAPEDKIGFEQVIVDPIGPDGAPLGPPRVLVEGRGLPLQTRIAVPIDRFLDIDVRGRRITMLLTMAQLRELMLSSSSSQ